MNEPITVCVSCVVPGVSGLQGCCSRGSRFCLHCSSCCWPRVAARRPPCCGAPVPGRTGVWTAAASWSWPAATPRRGQTRRRDSPGMSESRREKAGPATDWVSTCDPTPPTPLWSVWLKLVKRESVFITVVCGQCYRALHESAAAWMNEWTVMIRVFVGAEETADPPCCSGSGSWERLVVYIRDMMKSAPLAPTSQSSGYLGMILKRPWPLFSSSTHEHSPSPPVYKVYTV